MNLSNVFVKIKPTYKNYRVNGLDRGPLTCPVVLKSLMFG